MWIVLCQDADTAEWRVESAHYYKSDAETEAKVWRNCNVQAKVQLARHVFIGNDGQTTWN